MFSQVSILVPFKADNAIRSKAFDWILRYYHRVMPEVEICVGENHDEPFNKCKAINTAARSATRGIFVVADSDVFYDPQLILEAVQLLQQEAWVIPFNRVIDVCKETTEELLSAEPQWPLPIELRGEEGYMAETFAGKINVFSREAFKTVGGFDERFVGWGGEDDAFFMAMNTLCGPFLRINRTVYHCWHPWVGPANNPYYTANLNLFYAYQQAYGNREAMQELLGHHESDI